jgi:hypothetical protein
MRSEKAIMTSRLEFLSNALGIALVTAGPWPVRAAQARSKRGQSDSSASKSRRTTQKGLLRWDVFLAPSIPAITSDLPPGDKQRPWPPISSTLISGERDAVLVDAPITVEQARALVDWVAASGKNLTTIYATHGHGDHFFGTSTLLDRFPGARFVARPEVIKIMRQHKTLSPDTGSTPLLTQPGRAAGTDPGPRVHAEVIAVMGDAGFDLRAHRRGSLRRNWLRVPRC